MPLEEAVEDTSKIDHLKELELEAHNARFGLADFDEREDNPLDFINPSNEEFIENLKNYLVLESKYCEKKAVKSFDLESDKKAFDYNLVLNFLNKKYIDPNPGKERFFKLLRSLETYSRIQRENIGSISISEVDRKTYNKRTKEHNRYLTLKHVIKEVAREFEYINFESELRDEAVGKNVFEI